MTVMPPDATDTKRRLLEAAFAEFAELGLAGARIDRIAERAGANKRLLYVHFGNKEQLFDLVTETALAELMQAVPFTAEDLPGYAGALFDYLHARPEVLRLGAWGLLERPPAVRAEVDAYRAKIAALSRAQAAGIASSELAPAGLLSMILALVTSWDFASPALTAQVTDAPFSAGQLAARRQEIVTAVKALTTPAPAGARQLGRDRMLMPE